MANQWTISVAGAAAAPLKTLKIEGGSIEFVSRGRDQAELYAHASVEWTYGDLIGIYLDGTRVFYGRVLANKRLREPGVNADRAISVAGVQYWLERCPFRQNWSVLLAEGPGLAASSRVILNAQGDTSHITVDGQLAAIVGYAQARGCPLQFGSSSVGVTLPYEELRDVTCRQAIERTTRLTPDVCDWVDYSTTPPTIHFGQGNAFTPTKIHRDTLAFRDDLVVPGLQIEIERVNTHNGSQYRTLEYLAAGDLDSIDTVFVTLALAGREFSSVTRSVDVVAEEIGDYTAASWWKAKHPRLANIDVSDIDVIGATRSADPAADFPRISSSPLPDLTAAGCKAVLETFRATVDLITRDDSGNIIGSEVGVELTMEFVSTNAFTKTYRWTDSVSITTAETAPPGLAADLLAHWSQLYAEGTFEANLSAGLPHPGQLVESTPIQSVRVDLESKTVTGTFGPPAHLSAQDFCSLMQAFRTTRKSFRSASQTDASVPSEDEDDKTVIAPVSYSDWSPGAPTRVKIAIDGKSADINPSEDLDDAAEAKFRTIEFKDKNGNTQNAQILATEPKSGEAEEPADPCNDHPEGGDGVSVGAEGGGALTGGGASQGGVPADDGGESGAAGCTTQCEC